jgi:hypothetical protein
MSFRTLIAVCTLTLPPTLIGAPPAVGQSTHDDTRQLRQTVAAGKPIRVRLVGGPTYVVRRPVMTDYGIEGIENTSG